VQGPESFASLPNVALPACGGGAFRGARAFCAGMWRGVPRGTGLLRRQAAGQGSFAGQGPFAPACGGEFRGAWAFCAGMWRGVPWGTGLLRRHAAGEFRRARAFCAGMRRGGGVPRRASDLVRAATRPGAGPFRQNGKSTENREKQRIDPKQRIDGI